ncbi:MAG: PDZ domain-containing protein, partial [Deltaproteobacteria bacterium]|nr:PDZ domain-containing protein [Deltaproteobacteria bacterium]
IASSIAVLIAVGAGFYGGVEYARDAKVIKIENSREVVDADFKLFWEAIQVTKDKYVDAEKFNDQELVYGAIRGALATLKDPYTTFFAPSDAKKFEEDLEGAFGGIGAEIGVRNNELTIVAPLKGNPAEEVGLKAGDKILKVGDTVTSGMAVEENSSAASRGRTLSFSSSVRGSTRRENLPSPAVSLSCPPWITK